MSDEKLITWLSNLSKTSVKLVGEKASNLGEIYNAKFPVPQAFVITSKATNLLLQQNKLTQPIKDILNKTTPQNIQDSSKEIQNLILNSIIPKQLENEILEAYDHFNIDLSGIEDSPGALAILKSAREPVFVSIKPSLEYSTPHKSTIINIKGNAELLQKIKEAISKVFSKDTILEHKESNLENLPQISLIIQKMINSDKSGVIYSKNPIDKDESILLKASFGQKTTKDITPDTFTLSKNFEILDEIISNKKYAITRTASGQTKTINLTPEKSSKRTLKTYELKQLAEFSLKLEELFSCPQETKFAIENEEIFIIETKSLTQENQESTQEIQPIIPTRTKIKLIIDPTLYNKESKNLQAEEIGLLKLENFITANSKEEEPNPEEYKTLIKKAILKIKKDFPDQTIWVKIPEIKETSQTKSTQKIPKLFSQELLAIKESSTKDNPLGILLPKITSPEEINHAKKILQELDMQNPLGIILETPAASVLIKDICKTKINLVTFDTKSLAKLTLANPKSPNENSWAILKQISRVMRECKNYGIETSIHSQAATLEEILKFLIKQNITSVSLLPTQASETSKLIQKIETSFQIEPINNKEELEEELEELQKTEDENKSENLNPEPVEIIEEAKNPQEETKKEDIFN